MGVSLAFRLRTTSTWRAMSSQRASWTSWTSSSTAARAGSAAPGCARCGRRPRARWRHQSRGRGRATRRCRPAASGATRAARSRGAKTASATTAERLTLASASSARCDWRGIGRFLASTTIRSSGPRVRVGSRVMTKSPFFERRHRRPRSRCARAGRPSRGRGSPGEPPARPRSRRPWRPPSRAPRPVPWGVLQRLQPLVEASELVRHLGAELVERAALAGRVEQHGELRGVAVEVSAHSSRSRPSAESRRPSSNRSPTRRLSLPESPR